MPTGKSNISSTPFKERTFRQERRGFYKTPVYFFAQDRYNEEEMTVYIEYAIAENFLYDGIFLSLALYASREKWRWKRVVFSAAVGTAFALAYPILRLSAFLSVLLKISVGFLLCMLAFGRIKTKKDWKRYALTSFFFFLFSFGFGGALLGLARGTFTRKIPSWIVFSCVCALSFLAVYCTRKLYARKNVYQYIYECEICAGGKIASADGFFDSGNQATKNGVPICFLSPDLLYDLFLTERGKEWGQVRDEMEIRTVSGTKKVPLYLGKLRVFGERKKIEKTVYFASSANMIRREYKILLNARTFEG